MERKEKKRKKEKEKRKKKTANTIWCSRNCNHLQFTNLYKTMNESEIQCIMYN